MRQGFLLDTNVVSELVRSRPAPLVSAWVRAQSKTSLFLSVITLGELQKGIALAESSQRRSALNKWLETDILPSYANRLLPITEAISRRWGLLLASRQRAGRPIGEADGLIAATALEHNLIVTTRNTRDFDHIGLALLNPWL